MGSHLREPAEGNPVNAFSQSNVSSERWIDGSQTDVKKKFELRLKGRVIEKMVEDMILAEQKSKLPENASPEQVKALVKQIQGDVTVLETDNVDLKGKFAGLKMKQWQRSTFLIGQNDHLHLTTKAKRHSTARNSRILD